MTKQLLGILGMIAPFLLSAQQLPFFSQYMASSLVLNPAIAGTKRAFDARISYRNQWTGFDGAPKTAYISLNSRISKGRFGMGGVVYKDETGPTSLMNYAGSFAAHIRYPDVEVSLGLSVSLMQYRVNSNQLFIENPMDNAVGQTAAKLVNLPNAGLGFYLYNDRFSVAFSSMNSIGSKVEFYNKDSVIPSTVTRTILEPHAYFSFGYNYSGNPDFVWENSFFANYVSANPMVLGYSLRLFYKNQLIFGSSVRVKEAVVLHAGYVLKEATQISYSYDIITSRLGNYNNGSHEILIAYSMKIKKNKRRRNEDFLRQKYGYMF